MTTASRIRPTACPWYSPVTAAAATASAGRAPGTSRPVAVFVMSALTYQRHRRGHLVAAQPPVSRRRRPRSEGELDDPGHAARQPGEAAAGQDADDQHQAVAQAVRRRLPRTLTPSSGHWPGGG